MEEKLSLEQIKKELLIYALNNHFPDTVIDLIRDEDNKHKLEMLNRMARKNNLKWPDVTYCLLTD